MIRHPRILPAVVFLVIGVLAIVPGLLLGSEGIGWVVDGVLLMMERPDFLLILLAGSVAVWFLRFQSVAIACALAQIGIVLAVEEGIGGEGSPAAVLWLLIFSLGAFLPTLALAQIVITLVRPGRSRENGA